MVVVFRRLIAVTLSQLLELLNAHRLLLYVDLLVNALLARHHLADGCWDGHVQVLDIVAALPGHVLLRGDDLKEGC